MNLGHFLLSKRISVRQFAEYMDVSRHTVINWINGGRPHMRHCAKILKISDGKISLESLGWEESHKKRVLRFLSHEDRKRFC